MNLLCMKLEYGNFRLSQPLLVHFPADCIISLEVHLYFYITVLIMMHPQEIHMSTATSHKYFGQKITL